MGDSKPHINTALLVMQVVLVILVLSCLITMMFSSMGGSRTGNDIQALRHLQMGGTAFAGLGIVVGATYFLSGRTSRAFWAYVPGWLMFSAFLLLFIVFIGELSYLMLRDVGLVSADSVNHLALICMTSATLSLLIVHATRRHYRGLGPCKRGRW